MTDKTTDNQKASAPETRTGFDYWHPKSKAFDPDPDKRTIPAEKPTEATYKVRLRNGLALTESMELERQRDEAQAQAAQLAEALRAAQAYLVTRTAVSERIGKALVAYEEGK